MKKWYDLFKFIHVNNSLNDNSLNILIKRLSEQKKIAYIYTIYKNNSLQIS